MSTLILCNARSAVTKVDEIHATISAHSAYAALITESWYNNDIPDSALNIPGMLLFRYDRPNRVGGGVAIYVKYDLDFYILDNTPLLSFFDWIAIYSDTLQTLIICSYIPPNLMAQKKSDIASIFICFLDDFLIQHPYCKIIMAGDFNDFNTDQFCNHTGLKNVVLQPTRNIRILDKILLNDICLQDTYTVDVGHPLANSDHNIVVLKHHLFTDKVKSSTERFTTLYDFRDSNLNGFYEYLINREWEFIYNNNYSINDKVIYFNDIMNNATKSIPSVIIKLTGREKCWFSPLIKHLINLRWAAFRNKNFIMYNHYKNKVKSEISKAKANWASNCQSVPRKFWKSIANLTNNATHDCFNRFLPDYGNYDTMANALNKLFTGYFNHDHYAMTSKIINSLNTDNYSAPTINPISVTNEINRLKKSTSVGTDNISSKILKLACPFVVTPLTHIYQLSISSGEFPKLWKTSIITPINKTRKPKITDFRPINVLPAVAKVLERIVINFVYNNINILSGPQQHGFKPGLSTCTALIHITDAITLSLDKCGHNTYLMSFDLSKAFDKVPHSLLINKLYNGNLPIWFIKWCYSYITGRHQMVKIHNCYSSILPVNSGVIQGSVLGPYLFSAFVGDFQSSNANCTVIKYADDFNIIITTSKDADLTNMINVEVNNITEWAHSNGLSINHNKTQLIRFGYNLHNVQSETRILANIPVVRSTKILGITIDSLLNWNNHINNVVKKQSSGLYLLRRLKHLGFSKSHLLTIFYLFIRAHADYCCPVFIGASKTQFLKLDSISKRAHKIICGNTCNCICEDIFPSSHSRSINLAINIFNKINALGIHTSNQIPHRLANTNKYNQIVRRTNWRSNSFFVKIPQILNKR